MLVEKVMANQWFTGLVTPSQWDFAWLYEGFATYLKYFATATVMYFLPVKRINEIIINVLTEIYYIDSAIENIYLYYFPSILLISLILILENLYKIDNFSKEGEHNKVM